MKEGAAPAGPEPETPPSTQSVAPELVGREASCRSFHAFFEAADQKGIPRAELADGTGVSLAELESARERVSWKAFMRLLENVGRLFSDAEIVAMGRTVLQHSVHRAFTLPGRILFSPRDMYVWGGAPNGPVAQTLVGQTMSCKAIDERHVRMTVVVAPEYAMRREFWLFRQGFLESVPGLFGLPLAEVTVTNASARGALFDISLPPDKSLVHRVRQRASWIFAAREAADQLRRANEDLHRRYVELQREVAARKEAEAQLVALNAELEKRVADRTNELELFSYSVAHDLRAPLRAINGFATAVLQDYDAVLDANAKRHLERVVDAGIRMGALIDSLLALSRVTRARLRHETVDLAEVARSVFDELRAVDPHRAVALHVDGKLVVTGDPTLLRALIHNLLENAWKFTKGRTPARITLERKDASVICVRDNGAGFDMQHAKTLFAPFHRLHSGKEFAGTGIGLALCDRIVRRHGGTIWVEAAPNEGATFSFTLGELAPDSRRP